MHRKSLFILFLALSLAGCYAGPGYYESEVYTQPATVVAGGYSYDNGYRANYYQERRIYVGPVSQSRYYSQPRINQPRYYFPPPRYQAPPPLPRYYQPGRPPGHGWEHNRLRGSDPYRYRNNYNNRGNYMDRGNYRGQPSWNNRSYDRGPGRGGWHRGGHR